MIPESGFLGMLPGATLGVQAVLVFLVLMSLWSWAIILQELIAYRRAGRRPACVTSRPTGTMDFVVTSALAPSLALAAEHLAKLLPQGMPCEHGHCPLCGSRPYISLLRGREGRRHAVCSFCAHEYRLRRIACASCDEADQDKLKQFRVQEHPGVRVDVCGACQTYIKTLDYRDQEQDRLPPLDELATVALDILAQQQGYARPTPYAWGF